MARSASLAVALRAVAIQPVAVLLVGAGAGLFALEAQAAAPRAADREVAAVEASAETSADTPTETSRGAPASDAADPECDRLFGAEDDQEQNAARRQSRLILVEDGPSYIDVVQTGGWTEPTEIAFRGLTLKDTMPEAEETGVAVFEVEPELGFCDPGEYEVEVDDSIGDRSRVLAILPGLVVVEHGDGLRYVRSETFRGQPTFKVSWRSPFSIVVESDAPTKSPRSRRSARRRRRR